MLLFLGYTYVNKHQMLLKALLTSRREDGLEVQCQLLIYSFTPQTLTEPFQWARPGPGTET